MRKRWFAITLLVALMFVLADAGLNAWDVNAFYCQDISGCGSHAGCPSIRVSNCEIECIDGTTLTCVILGELL